MKLGEVEDPDEMTALIDEQAELQEKIDAADAWDLQRTVEIAMDALRCPPGDSATSPSCRAASGAASRCAGCCSRSPTCCCSTSRPTISMPNRSPGWSSTSRSTRARWCRHPRPLLPRQRDRLDSGARPRPGHSVRGQLLGLAGAEAEAAGAGSEDEARRQKTLARELEWIRQSPKARQAKSKARITAYEKMLAESGKQQRDEAQIVIPPGPRLGGVVIEAENVCQRPSATACCSRI